MRTQLSCFFGLQRRYKQKFVGQAHGELLRVSKREPAAKRAHNGFHSSVQPTFRLDRQREAEKIRGRERELRRACGLCETLNSNSLLFFLLLFFYVFFFLSLSLSLFLCLCYVIRSRVRAGESEQPREREREHIARPKQMAWKIGETFTFSSQRHGLTHSKRAKREVERESARGRESKSSWESSLGNTEKRCEMRRNICESQRKHMIFCRVRKPQICLRCDLFWGNL